MKLRERLLKTMRGEKHDRVPLVLEGFHFRTADEVDAIAEPRRRELAERAFPHVNGWVHAQSGGNRYLVTPPQAMTGQERTQADGTVVTTTEFETPRGSLTAVVSRNPTSNTIWTNKYPCESLADIEKIRSIPWRAWPGVGPPDLAELPETFDERCVLRGACSSPVVCAAGMMPYEYFLELCATHLGLIRELTELCLDRTLTLLDAVLAEGTVEYVWMGGCEWLTPPMGSPRLYAELVQPFERKVIERIHAAGALAHVHCHGNVRSSLEQVVERGADFFEPVEPPPDGDIGFAEAKRLVAGRMTLGGNVEARILERGTADEVERATRAAFEGPNGRMVLRTTAGPIGPVTPRMLANYHRMIDVWEELSPL